MTKELEDKSDKSNNAEKTVSTPTDISQTNFEKNHAVESNVNEHTNEVNINRKSEMSGNSENKVEKDNLDNSEQNDSGVQNEKLGIKEGMTKTSTIGQNEHKKIEDTDEEDVPGDFFDDFLKEDFMAGLDIVDDDAWEKELELDIAKNVPVVNTVETKKKKEKKKSKASTKIDHVERFHISPPGEKRHKQKKRKHDDSKDKHEDKEKHTKSKEKAIDADEFDIRRDPEKTKRDLEQYKAKCEKDKEKKMISEKLSFVETGLVPPGMEMEIDIEEVKRQKTKIEQNQPPRDLRERLRRLRSKSKSPGRRQRSPKRKSATRKSASPKKRRTKSPKSGNSSRKSPLRVDPSKNTKKSPLNEAMVLQKRSPLRIRRSPLPFRSPIRRRSYDRKSPSRRSRSHSPYYRGRRSRYSPFQRHRDRSDSRESEREKWLRRRRTRSRSPRRKREEKKSFLQEIAEKLNETRPQPVNIMQPLQPPMHYVHPQALQPVPVPVPAPTPVPAPNNPQFFPRPQSQQQFDPYDQNFFIGTPQPVGPPNFVGQQQNNPPTVVGFSQPQIPLNPLSIQPINSPQLHNSFSPAGNNMLRNMDHPIAQPKGPQGQINVGVTDRSMPQPQGQQINIGVTGDKKDLAKLFQDKKITLSEFLAITAKPEVLSSSPANLQEKIKVIQRCHEAIKILGSAEKKYTGKLIVHRTDNYKISNEASTSPLLRRPLVTFPFTQHQVRWEQKASFTTFINQLLQKIGLMKEAVVDVEKAVPANVGIQSTSRALSPPPPPLITSTRNIVQNDIKSTRWTNKLTNNQLSKFIQTDVFKCENCEKRKKILYKTSAVQCGGDTSMFSVSTQVTEEDFYAKNPKTQSLASLTPAQLLAKSRAGLNRMIDKDNFDILPSQSNYANRMNFLHPSDNNYAMSRYRSPSPPPLHFNALSREEVLPSMYNNSLRSPFIGGGGRGRDNPPIPPRGLDSINRFGYNYY